MQKALIYILYTLGEHASLVRRVALWAVLAGVAVLLLHSTTWFESGYYTLVDNPPNRGAKALGTDTFGDRVDKIAYLDQGWSAADSLWYYNVDQGSDLLPYDFFLSLEQAGSQEAFRSDRNMNHYRYLPQTKSHANPDALPVGMVADQYRGKKYMGFTCAACHSSQVDYNGVGIRIDGGPSAADMDSFMHDLAASLDATRKDAAKKQRFIAAVLKGDEYSNAEQVAADLEIYTLRVQAYNYINESPTAYGYARLDAFGRIYNRVLEHVQTEETLLTALTDIVGASYQVPANLRPVLTQDNRDHVMGQLSYLLPHDQLQALRDRIFNRPDAPVSYPFVWDIPQHDFVQWNGIAANAGLGPVGRNTGEVIGVFGTLDWSQKPGWTVSSVIGGQGFGQKHISFESSVKVHNLKRIEQRLASLESPMWKDPATGLPTPDKQQVAKGEALFNIYCAGCHANIERASKDRRVVAHMDNVAREGTDPTMANNGVDYKGFSGILRNQYVSANEVGNILLDTKAPVAAILTKATLNVVATPDPDKWFFTRAADWAVDLLSAYRSNYIQPSVRSGDYSPDTTASPFESLRSYKGRSLNGIWATAPYLHNGSVPTLYDLLLPACETNLKPADGKCRPASFQLGSRELDVKKVGFLAPANGKEGFTFDTTQPGNSNAGHEYGTRDTKRLPALTDDQRWQLVEYLKTL